MTPLKLEALDPAWVPVVNESVGLGRGFAVPLPGGPFEFRFTTAPPRYAADRVFEVSFDREPVRAGVTDFAGLVERTGLLGRDGGGDRVPESLVPALVEAMLEEVIRAVQVNLGVRAGPVRSRPDPSESDAECRLHFTLSASGRPVTAGHLGFGAGLSAPIRKAIGALPKALAGGPAGLALFATVEIGWTTLPLSTLAGLAPDDLIFPDRMVAQPEDGPIVRLGPRLAFQARREGTELVLIGRVADAGLPHDGPFRVASPASAGSAPPGTVDPPIEVALVLGRVAIPLDRAAGLGPGARLAFAIDPTSVLQLVGGGRTLGVGRLIRLADRVAVHLRQGRAWPGRPGLPGECSGRAAGSAPDVPRECPRSMSLRLNELLPLRVHVEIHDDRAIVRLIGPIAAHGVGTLLSALERAEASGAREVVVDLRQVSNLGSSGVAALLIVANRLGPDRRLVLARPCEMVRRVCDVTGLVRFVVLRDQLPPGLETRTEWADNR